ncbi:hypothetical protein DUI87_23417 [Hirundo rustica rustica]|uniref:Uncharacterized protein n=1 Tax=Hirundo rustica rustica TaxID=333673 RepID=A0A3M0JGL3_HIRRU|nr:hypothetical protein DUI87_23417 [Hirundo rustica rustica]
MLLKAEGFGALTLPTQPRVMEQLDISEQDMQGHLIPELVSPGHLNKLWTADCQHSGQIQPLLTASSPAGRAAIKGSAVCADAEVMPFCEGLARDDNAAFGAFAQSPRSLEVTGNQFIKL